MYRAENKLVSYIHWFSDDTTPLVGKGITRRRIFLLITRQARHYLHAPRYSGWCPGAHSFQGWIDSELWWKSLCAHSWWLLLFTFTATPTFSASLHDSNIQGYDANSYRTDKLIYDMSKRVVNRRVIMLPFINTHSRLFMIALHDGEVIFHYIICFINSLSRSHFLISSS